MVGQEQDSYGGALDTSQAMTNSKIGHLTMSYDAVDPQKIEAGIPIADISNALAFDLSARDGVIRDSSGQFTASEHGHITTVSEGFEFTPNADVNGDIEIRYDVSDDTTTTAATGIFTVTPENDAPVIRTQLVEVLGVQAVDENAVISIALPNDAFTDVDQGDTLTYSLNESAPEWLTIDSATGHISGMPTSDDVGSHTVTVVATDAVGASAESAFEINVINTNTGPQIDTLLTMGVTDEQQVNATTEGNQHQSALAALEDGGYIAT